MFKPRDCWGLRGHALRVTFEEPILAGRRFARRRLVGARTGSRSLRNRSGLRVPAILQLLPGLIHLLHHFPLLRQEPRLFLAKLLVWDANAFHLGFQLSQHAINVRWQWSFSLLHLLVGLGLFLGEFSRLFFQDLLLFLDFGHLLLGFLHLLFSLEDHRPGLRNPLESLFLHILGLCGLCVKVLDALLHLGLLHFHLGCSLLELLKASLLLHGHVLQRALPARHDLLFFLQGLREL
mmetsp:Transcript_66688/g.157032  ORF Transcript_66688/g.157032 Transcript_66688/m.157032 type:complete len:236 (-) Transcript_66688:1189-1896(-)